VAITLCLAAGAGPGRAAGDVSVDGNRFLRDGRPWVAEGVALVALLTPEARREKKPTYAAARAAFGPGMLEEVRRFGADLVRRQPSPDHAPLPGLPRPTLRRAAGSVQPPAGHCSIRKAACRRISQPPTRNSVPATPST